MKICHIVASINENIGGPAYSVSKLVDHLSQQGHEVTLASLDYSEHGLPLPIGNAKHIHPRVSRIGNLLRGWSPELLSALSQELAHGYDLIHSHGLWMMPNIYARKLSQQLHIPLLITPRGMLESWSLGRAKWKKAFAWTAYERANLLQAAAFHATSQMESDSIRALGFEQPIVRIPNGIDLPASHASWSREQVDDFFPQLRGKRLLLFLSRLDPKKGIKELLEVWKELSPHNPDWHLILAGPDLVGLRETLETYVESCGLSSSLTFTGMVTGQVKEGLFSAAELFVLPSYSENFGNVIAESLSYGVPVVTTKGTPWSDLNVYDCGWWVDMDKAVLLDTLRKALSLGRLALEEKGKRGKTFVQDSYTWDKVADDMSGFYLSILSQ